MLEAKVKGKLIATLPGESFALKLYQTSKHKYTTVYGLEVKSGLSWLEAAHSLGEALFHSLECDGVIDRGA